MSVRVMTWVWDHSHSKKAERLVLLAIADCCSDDGSNAYPSMAELVRKTGLSERGVQGCIGKLTALGELKVHRNAGPGGCNRYRVLMQTTPAGTAGVQELRGAQKVRGQKLHPPAGTAPQPPQELRHPPAGTAPGTVLEPSIEPSVVQNLGSPNGSREPRGTRIPDNFMPDADMKTWFATNCPGVDGPAEHAKFCDYWRAQAGARARKTDWPATWRNWMRRAAESTRPGNAVAVRNGNGAGGRKPSTTDERVNAALALAAQYDAQEVA